MNTNKLVRNYLGCTGLKTGSTSLALYNLSASASRNGMDLIAVVMNAPTSNIRFKNASILLDYGFTNFEYKHLLSANEAIKSINIKKGIYPTINAVAENDCGVILEKGQDINIEQNISVSDTISAPVSLGQKIGTVTFTLNGETLATCNLLANKAVEKIDFFSMDKFVLNNWLNILRE